MALGTANFGGAAADARWGQLETPEARRFVDIALEAGVNLFDTADVYSGGASEATLGEIVSGRRDELLIATKVRFRSGPGPNDVGLSRHHIITSCEASLRRLGTDWIDLYQVHEWDAMAPLEETLEALDGLVRTGKVRYLGLSEAAPATIRRAHAVHPISALQTEYSIWARDPEAEILPTLRELGIGFVPYSPLGRGFLTGTLRSLDQLEENDFRRYQPRFLGDNLAANIAIVEQIDTLASVKGCTAAQVALAWVHAQGRDVAPIPGTKRRRYLEENIGALDVELSRDDVARLDGLATARGDRYADMSPLNG